MDKIDILFFFVALERLPKHTRNMKMIENFFFVLLLLFSMRAITSRSRNRA